MTSKLIVFAVFCLGLANAGVLVDMKPCNGYNPSILWNTSAITSPRQIVKNTTTETVCQCNPVPATEAPIEYCPEGWFHRDVSCYWFSNSSAHVADAVEYCAGLGATLFVANDKDELSNITAKTTGFRWIGITKENSDREAEWQSAGGMNITDINWLVQSSSDKITGNGWSDTARCVANYNPFPNATVGFFNYFYDCEWKFDYICERNATQFRENCGQNFFNENVPFQK